MLVIDFFVSILWNLVLFLCVSLLFNGWEMFVVELNKILVWIKEWLS